jgi:hypothetical protein
MKKNLLKLSCCFFVIIVVAGCKKDAAVKQAPVITNQATIGLYQYATGTDKRIFIPITNIGTKSVNYLSVFDTGSSGMTIDADGILPASMITSSGIKFTGDSVVVDGITVTSTTGVMSYGDNTGLVNEYGNIAYATITIGDITTGTFDIKRIPIFLYYKIEDMTTGKIESKHSNDVFGVGPGSSYASDKILSPLSYLTLGTGQIDGFKLAALNSSQFTGTLTNVNDLLTVGLTPDDINSSGFIMHPLTKYSVGGYSADIPATITYSGNTISGQILFDTGTPSVTIIEKPDNLPDSTLVTITTNKGFKYSYITMSTDNLTEVQNPNVTGDPRTIFSLDFFIHNEYLTDYSDNRIGLKNN